MDEVISRNRCRMLDCWEVLAPDLDAGPPMQVCDTHLREVGEMFVSRFMPIGSQLLRDTIAGKAHRDRLEQAARSRYENQRSVVYYARIGDHVKIGYTTNLPLRANQLRIDRAAVLAAEPGWREVEAERHAAFAEERVGRREDFNPSRRLLAHIEQVREQHGDPMVLAGARRLPAA